MTRITKDGWHLVSQHDSNVVAFWRAYSSYLDENAVISDRRKLLKTMALKSAAEVERLRTDNHAHLEECKQLETEVERLREELRTERLVSEQLQREVERVRVRNRDLYVRQTREPTP